METLGGKWPLILMEDSERYKGGKEGERDEEGKGKRGGKGREGGRWEGGKDSRRFEYFEEAVAHRSVSQLLSFNEI